MTSAECWQDTDVVKRIEISRGLVGLLLQCVIFFNEASMLGRHRNQIIVTLHQNMVTPGENYIVKLTDQYVNSTA